MNNTITINRNPAGIYFIGILLCVLTLSSCASKDVRSEERRVGKEWRMN